MLEIVRREVAEAEQQITDRRKRRGLPRLVAAMHDMHQRALTEVELHPGKGAITFER